MSATDEFILAHRNDDVRRLALQANRHPEVDMQYVLRQIGGWQAARAKLPSWAAHDDIVYPPHLSLEQCSSETTALYKAGLCRQLLDAQRIGGGAMADLTGGMGVDFAALAPLFTRAFYIERQAELCDCARHNLRVLGLTHAEVMEGDGLDLLPSLPQLDLLFIDPARRDQRGARTFAIGDCTPNILPVLPKMLQKARCVMVKLSPMLDWHQAAAEVSGCCKEALRHIHIVATANECKELLLVLSSEPGGTPLHIWCSNDSDIFVTDAETERTAPPAPVASSEECNDALWLYEPNAAVMKAGCFGTLAQRYPLKAVAQNSHLFIGKQLVEAFPGRRFRVCGVTTLNKRSLRERLDGITSANITVRNFPLTAVELRKRLRLADGGSTYIMATTTAAREHLLFVCEKG